MEPRISIITLGVRSLEESYKFYKDGLGLPTTMNPKDGIVFFKTSGACLALYPEDKLAEDVGENLKVSRGKENRFSGVTLAHNTRSKEEVVELLKKAESAGGRIEKEAQDVFWGGFSGYFSDPDGHLWEVAYADSWKFNPDGSLVI
ncbi:MAG: VOC family protein [Puniceicoccaceae bacterium]